MGVFHTNTTKLRKLNEIFEKRQQQQEACTYKTKQKKNAKKSRHKINDMLAKVKELKTQEINIKKRKPIKWDKHLIAVHQRPNEKRLN